MFSNFFLNRAVYELMSKNMMKRSDAYIRLAPEPHLHDGREDKILTHPDSTLGTETDHHDLVLFVVSMLFQKSNGRIPAIRPQPLPPISFQIHPIKLPFETTKSQELKVSLNEPKSRTDVTFSTYLLKMRVEYSCVNRLKTKINVSTCSSPFEER